MLPSTMLRVLLPVLMIPVSSCTAAAEIYSSSLQVHVSPVVHAGVQFSAVLTLPPTLAKKRTVEVKALSIENDGKEVLLAKHKLSVSAGAAVSLKHEIDGFRIGSVGRRTLRFKVGRDMQDVKVTCIHGWASLLPPLVTLAVSILYKQVIVSLLLGIWAGALMTAGFDPVRAFLRTFDTYFVGAFTGEGNSEVLLFTFLLGGTLGLVQRSGGALGLANYLKQFMRTRARGEVLTAALGCLIFFDDYSSILIVGNSLRDVVRAVGVSRTKFAWLVHSMGVVLTSLSPISSWVGLQIGYTRATLDTLDISPPLNGFLVVLRSLPFRFFPLFYLIFMVVILASGKDFGPMAASEHRESEASPRVCGKEKDQEHEGGNGDGGGVEPKPGTPLRPCNALVPFSAVIIVTISGMIMDGIGKIEEGGNEVPKNLVNILSSCDSVSVLIWASAAGWLTSGFLVCGQGILTLSEAMETCMQGMKEVLEPQLVLLLAWALGHVIKDTQTAEYLAGALETGISPSMLPALVSVLCYMISYACGSTFGTMGIVFPLVGPLAWRLGGGDVAFLHHCFASILGGSIFGNVCSPISDTTILTGFSTGCRLSDHVRTAGPYTFLIAALSIAIGNVPVGIGLYGPWVALLLGAATIMILVFTLGKARQGSDKKEA